MEIALYTVLIVAGLYLAVCAFYYFFQERLIFVPLEIKTEAPIQLASKFDEYDLQGDVSGQIHAIHIKCKKPRGCVLYFHGNTGSISRWGVIAEELTSFGFDVFLPDYRGYGKSRGPRTEETLYSDALLCYNKVKELYPENQICVYGRSLGTALACWLASCTNPAAIILETPFNDFQEVAAHHSKIFPISWLLRYNFKNGRHLKQADCPILIIHGTKDKIVPYSSGLRLYKAVQDNPCAQMLTIPRGKHGNLNGFPIMRDKLSEFFDDV
jgi:alpha-beta hydrolase superfamily lysophospholipase